MRGVKVYQFRAVTRYLFLFPGEEFVKEIIRVFEPAETKNPTGFRCI